MRTPPKKFPAWARWIVIVVAACLGLFLLGIGWMVALDREYANATTQARSDCRLIMQSSMTSAEAADQLKKRGFERFQPKGGINDDAATLMFRRHVDYPIFVLRYVDVTIKYDGDKPVSCDVDQGYGAP